MTIWTLRNMDRVLATSGAKIAAGCLLGGGALALVALSVKGESSSAEEEPTRHMSLRRDKVFSDLLSGPEELFRRVDQEETDRLRDALDGLAALSVEATSSGSPALFAKALRLKRSGVRSLDMLLASTRLQFPGRALEVIEDCEALRKALGDYAHNIQQASSLCLLEGRGG